MTLGNEKGSVQNPFIRYSQEAGWTYLTPDEALRLRNGGVISPVLDSVLVAQLQKLNPKMVDYEKANETVGKLVRVKPNIEGNLNAWEFLKGLKTVFVASEKREKNIRLLDTDNLDANQFHVTDEFTFSNGTPPDIRADLVFFINGVPVLIVETKKASALEGIAQALDDIRYYHHKAPEFLALNQLHALTHVIQFYYGATWNLSSKYLFNWRDEAVQHGDFESLCKSFVAPRRIMRVLTDFILFTRKDDALEKVVLRPHQMRAVERCVGRARDAEKKRGLVWHTQGSGKTYTMIVVAKLLIKDPQLENPTVLLLVDRNELEAQLFGNLESIGFGQVEVAESKEHLRKLLKGDQRGLIISMIHKFDKMPADVNTRQNIFVLVDEAHRTTGGDLGNYLMGALPNATYIGFTGTPIDKTAHGKGTFKTFGLADEKGYLDKYSIKESISDGTTVPLHYALAPNDLQVDRETLEREFLNLAEAQGVSDVEDLNRILEKAVTLKNMLKNRDRIEKVAAYAAKHFVENVEEMGYKAFLVAVDREACCLYKDALDRHLPADYSTVVISQAGKNDAEIFKKRYLSDDQEKKVRKEFRKADTKPKILIVTEKLLTGFDAPILYAMYLDKPMRDHVLLQAIARVNRPYEDGSHRRKPCGFVLDFVGIFDKLEKALAFDSEDVTGVIEGIDKLQDRFAKMMALARETYLPISADKHGDKAVEAVLEYFRDKVKREEFYSFFKELQDIYEILSPDPFLRPFLYDYEELVRMYYVCKSAYDRQQPVDREFLRKTEKLVQEQTQSGEIQAHTKFAAINADALEAISAGNEPDTVKIFNLLKALAAMVADQAGMQPYLINIGDRAEEIAQMFEDRQITTQQALAGLENLVSRVKEAETSRDETKLTPDAFAVFYYLRNLEMENEKALVAARKVENAFEQYPHWKVSEKHERNVRMALYKVLDDVGVEDVTEVGSRLIDLLRRASL
jgi:type I restriction enzyme, R subunit